MTQRRLRKTGCIVPANSKRWCSDIIASHCIHIYLILLHANSHFNDSPRNTIPTANMDPTTQARPADDFFKSTEPSHAVPAPVPTPADINNQRQQQQQQQQNSAPEATGIRQRVNKLSHSVEDAASHPAVQNAKQVAVNQTRGLRERLGKSPTIMKLERRTGIDRVALVGGGVLL